MPIFSGSVRLSKYLAFTLVITTLFVLTNVSDPVNITKLLVLGTFGFGVLGLIGIDSIRDLWAKEKSILISGSFFVISLYISVIFSKEPFVQNLYGVLGRNTGALTYTLFVLLFLATLLLNDSKSISIYLKAFLMAGILNVLYGLWVRLFGDFIPWTNNYGALLGTFGNPDFAGAFLGILSGVLICHFYAVKSMWQKILVLVIFIFNLVTILDTKTTQGILVAATSMAIAIYFILKTYINKFKSHLIFMIILVIGASFSILGIFQKGPLSSLLYKRSVSLRGIYWDAAFKTGNENFLTGVGMDGFGNWFRQVRSIKAATWFPGPEVVTNVAHNIYLDIYASGGIFLLLPFIFLNIYSGYRLILILKRMQTFDWIAVSLAAIYVSYQAQAVISINQIGLGIWGWTILGAICAYERSAKKEENQQVKKVSKANSRRSQDSDKSIVLVPIFILLGCLIALPPFIADSKWTSALNLQDLKKLEEALKPSYFTPQTSERLANAVIILSNSNLDDQAYVYAKQGVEFSPNYFDGWKMLYYARKSTDSDRNIALENMKRLDPNNRTLDKLK